MLQPPAAAASGGARSGATAEPDAPMLDGSVDANAEADDVDMMPDFFAADDDEDDAEQMPQPAAGPGDSWLQPEPEPQEPPPPVAEQPPVPPVEEAEDDAEESGDGHGERDDDADYVDEQAPSAPAADNAADDDSAGAGAASAPSSSTAAAAAPRAGSDMDGLNPSDIVSGKRKVRSTTVMIDGYAVKRQNNYSLEEGEGSVWDRELSAGGVYADPAFAYREREAPAPVAEKPKAKAPAAPREASAEEKERLKRNEQMKAAKKAQAKARLRFLEPHRQILGRFGASLPKLSAAEKAEAEAANEATGAPSGAGGFFEDPAVTPPSDILVEMRDYQQRGLRWLVGMHRCGVNAILADEMGLGKTLQTIAFLAYLKFVEGVPGPHLVICPVPRALPSLPPSLPAPRPRRPRRLCASC